MKSILWAGVTLAIVLSICSCLKTEKPELLRSPAPETAKAIMKKAPAQAGTVKSLPQKAIELKPKDAVAYNSRGRAKAISGDYRGAIADLERALEINPDYELAKQTLRLAKAKIQK